MDNLRGAARLGTEVRIYYATTRPRRTMKFMRIARQIARFRLLPAAGAVVVAGCAQSVVVDSDFPTPLVQRLPVRMGIIYDDALRNYVHHEELPEQATWTIELGQASVAMLQPLFSTMFTSVQEVDDVPVEPAYQSQLDGVIKPTLEKFEFDVPVRTRDSFAEVWLQYRLSLYEPNGKLITEWPVSGYGKAEVMHSKEAESVNKAAVVAMREVGAAISTKFAEQPDVSYWLEERHNAAALSVETRFSE
jgi:hypothetical protein